MSEEQTTVVTPVQPVVDAPEKTPDQLAKEAQEAKDAAKMERIKLLQGQIKPFIEELFKSDFTVEEMGYAPDICKHWFETMSHNTEQYQESLGKQIDLQNTFISLKVSDLIPKPVTNEKIPEEVTA